MKEKKEEVAPFEWERILLSEELSWGYLPEVAFRASVMFLVLLAVLRFTGKRSVSQLTFFELGIIISLGSAVGDPMFYHDVPVLPSVVGLLTVIGLYKLVTLFSAKNKKFEKAMEGEPECLFRDGIFHYEILDNHQIPHDHIFMQFRKKQVTHLGQIKSAYLEISGEVSVFFAKEQETVPGLPLLPEVLRKATGSIPGPGLYSCVRCGMTRRYEAAGEVKCENCGYDKFVEAWEEGRIS